MILLFVIYVLLAIHFIMFHDLGPLVVVDVMFSTDTTPCCHNLVLFISHHAFELYKRIGDKRWRIHDCGLGLFFRRKFISFEYIELLLTSVGKTITIVAVYRPPPSTTNGLTPTFFFDELSTLLEQYVTIPGSLIIVGDFNFHVDTCDSETVTTFLQLFDVFNLNQHTNGSTHKDGHTLAGSCHL